MWKTCGIDVNTLKNWNDENNWNDKNNQILKFVAPGQSLLPIQNTKYQKVQKKHNVQNIHII